MKNIFYYFIVTFAIGFLIAISGCNNKNPKQAENYFFKKDTSSAVMDSVEGVVFQDTTHGGWHVVLSRVYENRKVSGWADSALVVNIAKDGKRIVTNRRIGVEQLMGKEEVGQVIINSSWGTELITSSSVYIGLFVGVPETDDGFGAMLAFTADGKMKEELYGIEAGEEITYDDQSFYRYLYHELSIQPADASALEKIASLYCTEKFAAELKESNYIQLLPSKFNKAVCPSEQAIISLNDELNYNTDATKGKNIYTKVEFAKDASTKPVDTIWLEHSVAKDKKQKEESKYLISGVMHKNPSGK